jgi:acetoin utilization deacetylase AcuC-like enzyme
MAILIRDSHALFSSTLRLSRGRQHCDFSVQAHIGKTVMETFHNHPSVRNDYPSADSSKSCFPIYYNDVYEFELPPHHRFPMQKYVKVRKMVQSSILAIDPLHYKSKIQCDLRVSPLATWDQITTTHCPSYLLRFLTGDQTEQERRNVGFPWSHEGVKRALSSTGGTVAAACAVCDALISRSTATVPVWAAHLAGGTHHAFYDRGEGFCVFSDIAVAANVVLQKYPNLVQRIIILDLDTHQGNGNAALFKNRSDVATFSLHCSANYFSPKEKSTLDVELPAGCTDETYLVTLNHWLKQIETKGGHFQLVFLQAGVDILEQDRLGRMSISHDGIRRRNQLVFDFCKRNNLPLVITMGGGYPKTAEPWEPILEAHAGCYLEAYKYLREQF